MLHLAEKPSEITWGNMPHDTVKIVVIFNHIRWVFQWKHRINRTGYEYGLNVPRKLRDIVRSMGRIRRSADVFNHILGGVDDKTRLQHRAESDDMLPIGDPLGSVGVCSISGAIKKAAIVTSKT